MEPRPRSEFGIRTKEMHRSGCYEVAAHWAIRKALRAGQLSRESAIGMNWIKEMMELKARLMIPKGFVDC